jgi:hypothetical protein
MEKRTGLDIRAQMQLLLLGEVTRLLTVAGIPHWLSGGWVVSFHRDGPARPHSDIDFVLMRDEIRAVRALMIEHGFEECPDVETKEWAARFCRQGCVIEFTFVERKNGASYIMEWPWPTDGAFEGEPASLRRPVSGAHR